MKAKGIGIALLILCLPGAGSIAFGVVAYRALSRAIQRQRVKRIMVAVGPGRAPWKPMIVKS